MDQSTRLHEAIKKGEVKSSVKGKMGVFATTFVYKTKNALDFYDITDQVKSIISEHGVKNGIVTVFTAHTTTALKINEKESGFFDDFKRFMQNLIPANADYKHNDFDIRDPSTLCELGEECANGHSHCQQMLVGSASETIPVRDGEMALGRWQRIFLVELDHSRDRTVHVQLIGM